MSKLILFQTIAFIFGFIIDYFIGDPHRIPHPVCFIGSLISKTEKFLRRRIKKTNKSEFSAGVILASIVVAVSTVIPVIITVAAWKISPWLYLVAESIMCWQIIAARSLMTESMKVERSLENNNIGEARFNVSMIVGRDTAVLDDKGIARAAVETVAENTSDGVIAPMLFIFLFGAAGGFFYKSINTMDSMVGYKNEKYLYFGRAAAKLDDFVNFIPSRLSALMLISACMFCGLDIKNAYRIFRRDRKKHASPNSAQTEAVCAGALGLRLAGDAWYGGVLHKKEFIGDAVREIEYTDIARVNRLMYTAAFMTLILMVILRLPVIICL